MANQQVEKCEPKDYKKVLDELAKEKAEENGENYNTYSEFRDKIAKENGDWKSWDEWREYLIRKNTIKNPVRKFRLFMDYTSNAEIVKGKYQELGKICRYRLKEFNKDVSWLAKKTKNLESFLNALFDGKTTCQKEFIREIFDALGMAKEEMEKRGFYVYNKNKQE